MGFQWAEVAKSPAQIKRYLAVALANHNNRPVVEMYDRSSFRDLDFKEVSYIEGTGADFVYVITIKYVAPFITRQGVFELTKEIFELPPHAKAEERLKNDTNWESCTLRVAVPAKARKRLGPPNLLNVRRVLEV